MEPAATSVSTCIGDCENRLTAALDEQLGLRERVDGLTDELARITEERDIWKAYAEGNASWSETEPLLASLDSASGQGVATDG